MNERLRGIPKVDLHVHLDGSLRPATIAEWADELPEDRQFPDDFDVMKAVIPTARTTLEDYLRAFDVTVALLQTSEALERAAFELCEDAASESVIYMEIRFAPLLHLAGGMSPREVVQSALAGIRRAEAAFDLRVGLILCAMRDRSTEESMEVAQLAAQFRTQGVVAFDLAGPERRYPPHIHRTAVEFARDVGVHLTLHAGEGCCPEQIREAIDLGAERIGHGVYAFKDGGIVARLAERRIPLEICPTSNLQISGFMRTYRDHPLKQYLDRGIPITLNTDNRLMSQIDLTHEYAVVAEAFSLSTAEIEQIVLNGVEAAFTDDETKRTLARRVRSAFAPLG